MIVEIDTVGENVIFQVLIVEVLKHYEECYAWRMFFQECRSWQTQ